MIQLVHTYCGILILFAKLLLMNLKKVEIQVNSSSKMLDLKYCFHISTLYYL
jgi:hypothetical protein